jgi:2'-5' RNA ligase
MFTKFPIAGRVLVCRGVCVRCVRGCRPRPRGRHAIFFALYPPLERAAEIARFADRLFEVGVLGGRRVARERFHIALNYLGHCAYVPESLVAQTCATVSRLKQDTFLFALNKLKSFDTHNGRYPRMLTGEDGVIGAELLQETIHVSLAQERLIRGRTKRITPHLTLSYEAAALSDRFIAAIAWDVAEFCLVHSPQGESRHNILGRWRLAVREAERYQAPMAMWPFSKPRIVCGEGSGRRGDPFVEQAAPRRSLRVIVVGQIDAGSNTAVENIIQRG